MNLQLENAENDQEKGKHVCPVFLSVHVEFSPSQDRQIDISLLLPNLMYHLNVPL